MVGWHHRLDGHECDPAPGVGDGQGSLGCCSPWGCKELDTTERLNSERAGGDSPQLRGELSVQGTCLSVRLSLSSAHKTTRSPMLFL